MQLLITCQKLCKKKKMSAISGQRLARATLSRIEAMRNDESFDMFYGHVLKKAEGYNMVEEPKKGRKRSKPKYSTLQYVDGYNKGEAHHPETAKDQFQQIYFEAIAITNLFWATHICYICWHWKLLLPSITDNKTPDHKNDTKNYSDEVDILSLDVEMPI